MEAKYLSSRLITPTQHLFSLGPSGLIQVWSWISSAVLQPSCWRRGGCDEDIGVQAQAVVKSQEPFSARIQGLTTNLRLGYDVSCPDDAFKKKKKK